MKAIFDGILATLYAVGLVVFVLILVKAIEVSPYGPHRQLSTTSNRDCVRGGVILNFIEGE